MMSASFHRAIIILSKRRMIHDNYLVAIWLKEKSQQKPLEPTPLNHSKRHEETVR